MNVVCGFNKDENTVFGEDLNILKNFSRDAVNVQTILRIFSLCQTKAWNVDVFFTVVVNFQVVGARSDIRKNSVEIDGVFRKLEISATRNGFKSIYISSKQ